MTDELQRFREGKAFRPGSDSTDGEIEAGGDPLGFEATDGSDEEIEELADSVLTAAEASAVADSPISATKYVARQYGVDPSNYSTEAALLRAIARADGDPTDDDESGEIEAGGFDDSPSPEVEELADGVLTAEEAAEADENGESATNYLRREYGVNAAHYPNDYLLLQAKSDADDGAEP